MFLYSKTALLFSKYILTNVESSSKILPNSSNALLGTFTKISTVSSSFEVFFANLKLSVAVISKVPFWALKFKLVNTILVSEVAHANDVCLIICFNSLLSNKMGSVVTLKFVVGKLVLS